MVLKGTLSGSGIDRNYSAGFRKSKNAGFDRYSGGGIRENLGTGCDIGKEKGIRDGDDRTEFGMRDYREKGARMPDQAPLPRPCLYGLSC